MIIVLNAHFCVCFGCVGVLFLDFCFFSGFSESVLAEYNLFYWPSLLRCSWGNA